MPARDPEKRRKTMAAWRERAHTPAYLRWLGARRAFRMEAGDLMRKVAEEALAAENGYAATLILRAALDDLEERERAVGNRYDHELDEPFWDEGARPGPPRKSSAAVALGRKGGQKGGKARAASMTAEERSESARKAANARWQRPA